MPSVSRFRGSILPVLCLLWLGLVTAGIAKLWAFSETPGPAALASKSWPAAAHLTRDLRRPTLVMFLHPQCDCSSATVRELSLLMAHVQGRLTVHVLIYRPSAAVPGWERTDLWNAAAAIPGVEVSSDDNAAEATAFGAIVSGQTLLYDAGGQLAFSGGITFARGHSGDNDGRTAITSLVTDGTAVTRRTPVFGCFLREAAI